MSYLWRLEHVSLYGASRPRLDDVSVEIVPGTTAVVGYSGAGKTSLLNLLVGFERPDRGALVRAPAANGRLPMFWVPQDGGLWPHLTVRAHLRTVISDGGGAAAAADARIVGLLESFDLAGRADATPDRLSQGERSRLSVVRALLSGARTLVMDEPLLHVDPSRVSGYRDRIQSWCRESQTSLVIATHSPEEVLGSATRAVCLMDGKLAFDGTVDDLYHRPSTPQQAAFLGAANWIEVGDARRWLAEGTNGNPCVRPERLLIEPRDGSGLVVLRSHFVGSLAEVDLREEQSGAERRFYHRPSGDTLRAGQRVVVRILSLLWLWACLWSAGCGGNASPELPVQETTFWQLPAVGAKLPAPRKLTTSMHDLLYVLDDAARVLVYNDSGELVAKWNMPESAAGNPEAVLVLRDGHVVVADTHYHRVVYFDESGKVVRMFGSLGREPGQFIYPVALAEDDNRNLYVCEYGGNDRIQKFSRDGKFLLEFGKQGTEAGQFQRPSGILFWDGKLYVADAFNDRIQIFSPGGKFLAFLGTVEQGTVLHYPYDLYLSPRQELLVVEYGGGCVTALDNAGAIVGRVGETGRGPRQFYTPWGLAADSRGNIFVADTGNRRVVKLIVAN